MRQLSAFVAAAAMLLALNSAPLFHLHTHDDHGNPGTFVHAHFWHSEIRLDHSDIAIEEQDSHEQAHSIDLFAVDSPAPAFFAIAEFSDKTPAPSLETSGIATFIPAPRAHSPPDGRRSIPRSPPSI